MAAVRNDVAEQDANTGTAAPPADAGRPAQRWRFGNAELDEHHARLWVNGAEVALDRSSYELLLCLVRRAGVLVTKDELLRAGWPGRVVTENSLTKAIGRLRTALDDAAHDRLQSVAGYGYRLMDVAQAEVSRADHVSDQRTDAPVFTTQVNSPQPAAAPTRRNRRYGLAIFLGLASLAVAVAWLGSHSPASAIATAPDVTPPTTPATTSIAVLPFADLSPNHDQAYFSDGLAEELLTQLSHVPQLHVVARTSSFAFRGKDVDIPSIGRHLNARTILEGSVAKSEGRLRIGVQLINTHTGYRLWSETYERPVAELFAMQDDIAREVLGVLRIELLPDQLRDLTRHATNNAQAYQEYLLAMTIFKDDETAHRRSIAHLQRAVELDPNFIDAWYSLANLLGFSGLYADSAEEGLAGKKRTMEIAEHLIALAPERPEGYFLRGIHRYAHWWDWSGAEQDFELARTHGELEDDYLVEMARLRAALGRLTEARELLQRALQANPSSNAGTVMAYHHTAIGNYAQAHELLQRRARAVPTDEHAHYYLGLGELLQGNASAALPHFEDSAHELRLTGLALAHHALGDAAASERDLQLLISRYGHILPYQAAEVYAWRGENDKAFEWLQRARDLHDASFMYLKFDPLLAKIRGDSRFAELLQGLGLPP